MEPLHIASRPMVGWAGSLPRRWTPAGQRSVLLALALLTEPGETWTHPGIEPIAQVAGLSPSATWVVLRKLSQDLPGVRPLLVERKKGRRTGFRLMVESWMAPPDE